MFLKLIKENETLAKLCKQQGEKLLEQQDLKIINNKYANKLKNIQEVLQTNDYNNSDLQIRKIRKIINM